MSNDTPFSFVMQGHVSPWQSQVLAIKEEQARAAILVLTRDILQRTLEQEVMAELGPRRARRSDQVIAWACRQCGERRQRFIRRNGHYRRGLTIQEGTIELRVPLLRCRCDGYVEVMWQTLLPGQRYWIDVQLDAVRRYLAGSSHRLTADAVSVKAGTNVSHLVSWRTLQGVGTTRDASRGLGPCPRAVILDDVYVTVGGEERVFLLAVADDGRPLALWGPTTREKASWVALLDWLSARGIGPEAGLVGVTADGDSAIREAVHLVWPGVVLQQCIWHILERVAENAAEVYEATRPEVEEIVGEAASIFVQDRHAGDGMSRATQAFASFESKHKGTRWADTVERAFVEGTEYLRTPGLPRTNGEAERLIKELRRRIKVMDGFKSQEGGEHFAVVWVAWQTVRRRWAEEQRRRRRRRRPRNLKIRAPYPKPP